MEIILIIIGIIIVYSVIANLIEKRKQKIRDRAAFEILKDFDYEKEKQEILKITKPFIKEERICPVCSGILKIRLGKFGQFLGCSNYPQCRFTKNNH